MKPISETAEYRVYQRESLIYDGRYDAKNPLDTSAPPIQLFHPVFGHFLDDLSSDLPLPPEFVDMTIRYMRAASAIYEDEADRRYALEPRLSCVLDTDMSDKTLLGGGLLLVTRATPRSVMHLVWEDQSQLGSRGYDPSIQASLSTVQSWLRPEVNKCHFSLYARPP